MIILVGKSGSGKNTVLNNLLDTKSYNSVVSHTSRPKRDGEIEGKDYYFVTNNEFRRMLEKNKFIEFTVYNGNYYGISYDEYKKENGVTITEVDGVYQIKAKRDVVVVYIKASLINRIKRMLKRGDKPIDIVKRIIIDFYRFLGFERKMPDIIFNNNSSIDCASFINLIISIDVCKQLKEEGKETSILKLN